MKLMLNALMLMLVAVVGRPISGSPEGSNSLQRMVQHSAQGIPGGNRALSVSSPHQRVDRATARPLLGREAIHALSEDFDMTDESQIFMMDDFARNINRIMPVIRGDIVKTNYAYIHSSLVEREHEGRRNALHKSRSENLNDCIFVFNSDLPLPTHHGAMVISRDIRRFGLTDNCHWHVLADGLAFFSGPISPDTHTHTHWGSYNYDDSQSYVYTQPQNQNKNVKANANSNAVFKAMRGKNDFENRGLVNTEEQYLPNSVEPIDLQRRKLKLPRFRDK